MRYRQLLRHSDHRRAQLGFTMIELALTFTIIAILSMIVFPGFRRVMQSSQTRRNAAIVASDLERAFSLAARYRRPMRLSCVGGAVSPNVQTCASGSYTVADRTGGTVRLSRNLRTDRDLGMMTLTVSANPVDIFPSGVSTVPVTLQITSGGSTRSILMTTAGQVRILP
jgi:prepilin-type N-terminal cleavage/methylation domain-containing protein